MRSLGTTRTEPTWRRGRWEDGGRGPRRLAFLCQLRPGSRRVRPSPWPRRDTNTEAPAGALAATRFDYSGVGNSEGNLEECTVGKWRKDILSVIDGIAVGPQILVGSSLGGWLMLHAAIARPEKVMALVGVATAADALVTQFNQLPVEVQKEAEIKGTWNLPSKYHPDGFYRVQYSFIKEAEHHCLLHSPIPVSCPMRLLHGMKDDIVPWYTSMQVADQVLSTDVDVILRKDSGHRMKEKADLQLLTYTIDDLIDKLSIVVP
ncbi:PREDICTED: mycophenolic acid acyl-glucuronide esterase, mitochondrial isoform X2 [Chinchilla lanigera]|uniref:mycophenolic acid acyl-glucuronide esterase, mitochondrial isoform X2 n=1 Tax=Chinchilla lanigera TaxID=34839 RepID=UPI0006985EEE|nr:PREDICTED: mycophenolic acid acyl-glucuronide esterase, mitochondrial isoform X2 [Chinchilla lanigera]